jgi:hypothetical protein
MKRLLFLVFLLCVPWLVGTGAGQGQIGPNDACRNWDVNKPAGTRGPDIAVSTTPVTVIAKNQGLCGGQVINSGPSNPIRCLSIGAGDPTGDIGVRLSAGASIAFGLEVQSGVKCIRDSTALGDTTVNTVEVSP